MKKIVLGVLALSMAFGGLGLGTVTTKAEYYGQIIRRESCGFGCTRTTQPLGGLQDNFMHGKCKQNYGTSAWGVRDGGSNFKCYARDSRGRAIFKKTLHYTAACDWKYAGWGAWAANGGAYCHDSYQEWGVIYAS